MSIIVVPTIRNMLLLLLIWTYHIFLSMWSNSIEIEQNFNNINVHPQFQINSGKDAIRHIVCFGILAGVWKKSLKRWCFICCEEKWDAKIFWQFMGFDAQSYILVKKNVDILTCKYVKKNSQKQERVGEKSCIIWKYMRSIF